MLSESLLPSLSIASNIILAVGLIIINKWVMVVDKFQFTIVLCSLHYYASFFTCSLLLLIGVFQYKTVNRYDNLLRIVIGQLASTISMNYNLNYNSVGLYQMSKLACIPCTLIIESLLQIRKQDLTLSMILSLILIMIGVALFAIIDSNRNILINDNNRILGYIWAILSIIITSLTQVFFGPLQKELNLNSLQLLFHTSPLLVLGSSLLIPILENHRQLLETKITYHLFINIIISCIGATGLNITNYAVLSYTTPLTYIVIGHFKTIIIISFGALFFDTGNTIPPSHTILGIILAMSGVILYQRENQRQQDLRQTNKLEKDSKVSNI